MCPVELKCAWAVGTHVQVLAYSGGLNIIMIDGPLGLIGLYWPDCPRWQS